MLCLHLFVILILINQTVDPIFIAMHHYPIFTSDLHFPQIMDIAFITNLQSLPPKIDSVFELLVLLIVQIIIYLDENRRHLIQLCFFLLLIEVHVTIKCQLLRFVLRNSNNPIRKLDLPFQPFILSLM